MRILRIEFYRAFVKRKGFFHFAAIGQNVGKVSKRRNIIAAPVQRFAKILFRLDGAAHFAIGRAEREPQFGGVCCMGECRFQKCDRGTRLSARAQQIGQIDECFEALGLELQHAAEEFFGCLRKVERACGVAERKQYARCHRAVLRARLELLDGLDVLPFRGKGEARFVRIVRAWGWAGHGPLSDRPR